MSSPAPGEQRTDQRQNIDRGHMKVLNHLGKYDQIKCAAVRPAGHIGRVQQVKSDMGNGVKLPRFAMASVIGVRIKPERMNVAVKGTIDLPSAHSCRYRDLS